MSTTASRKAIALVILVFVLGVGLGVIGTVIVNARVYGALVRSQQQQQQPLPARAVARLNQELNLSPDQQNQLRTILGGMQSGYDGIRLSWQPQIDQVRSQGRNQIRAILTPQQLPKYESYLHMLDAERAKRNQTGLPPGNADPRKAEKINQK